MGEFLLKLLELSLQAGALTIVILLLRLVFRKLPAKYLCVLWMIVAARLILPFSIETGFAWAPDYKSLWRADRELTGDVTEYYITDATGNRIETFPGTGTGDEVDYYLQDGSFGVITEEEIFGVLTEEHVIVSGSDTNGDSAFIVAEPTRAPVLSGISNAVLRLDWEKLSTSVTPVLFALWLLGMVLLLGYGVHSCVKVKQLVKNAIPYEDNIWLCDGLESPFLFGWVRPRIYLPTSLEEPQMRYVIEHEKSHIARRDNYAKMVGYVLLAVYWFNPVIWVAYIMFCKDIERACDERVISGFTVEERKGYADALLQCSIDRGFDISNPLAFGEMDVKNRITGILKYKKPGRWIMLAAVLLCVLAVAGCFFVREDVSKISMPPSVTPTFTPTPTPTPAGDVWTQTITHIPSDLEHLESDWDLLGKTTPETLVAVPFGQTVTVDLNGDGAEESVTFGLQGYEGQVSYNKVLREPFFLEINETKVLQGAESIFHGESPCFTTYYIFDIDVTDGYKEIGLADYGPNGDVGVALYRYDNGTVQAIGGFLSAPLESDLPWNSMAYEAVAYEEMVAQVERTNFRISVPGDGTIWAKEREYLLETCGVVSKYQLENATGGLEARLKPAERERYMVLNWDSETRIEVTAAREFKAFVSDYFGDEEVVIVPEGSQITFYEYYLSHEDWGRGYVRFFYTVEEKWDSEGWLILSSEGIVMPRSSDQEFYETVEPDELFHNLSHAG